MAVINVEFGFFNKLVEEVTNVSGGVNVFDYSISDAVIRVGPGTSPAGSEVWAGMMAMASGTVTIGLGALARTGRTALNLTGLRVLGYVFKNLGTATMTLKGAATNPYPIFVGTTGHGVRAGGMLMEWSPVGFGTVGASAISIDVTGTGTESFIMGLVAGPV
jgi:hypothetical protein